MRFNVGDIVEGKITGIKDYGVFVDIGEGKSGMVHISEVANTFVSDINQFVKQNDVLKMKIIAILDDGKISLSIKQAQAPAQENEKKQEKRPKERKPKTVSQPDSSYVWTPQKSEAVSFEEMMNRFKATSDEKFSDLKRKNIETKRPRRGSGMK